MDNPFRNLSGGEKAAVGIGGLVVVWFAYKQHQASASAGTAASASSIDPLTGLPTSQDSTVDPLTGETYLAEAQQYGSVSAADQALSGEGLAAGYGYGSVGYTGTGSGYLVPAGTVQGTAYATNAAWAQAVEAGLTDIGYAPTDIAAALGRYLGGLSETSAQAGIVQAAIAEYGPPPAGSFQIIQAPAAGPAASGNTQPPKSLPAAGGLSVTPYKGYADFGWHAVPGAAEYHFQVLKGSTVAVDTHTTATDAHGITLPAGTYTWRVAADANSSYKSGPWAAGHSFTVK